MRLGRILFSICMATAIFTVILLTAIPASEARSKKVCKPGLLGGKFHSHQGTGATEKTKRRAMKSSAASWSNFTDWEYGKSWANIRNAIHVDYGCKSSGKRAWKCKVDAVPCTRVKR